jgi:hypothetical protein
MYLWIVLALFSFVRPQLQRNFALNPQSGLRISAYKNSHETRRTDRELPHLAEYLVHIAQTHADFNKVDHSKWKTVVPAPPPRNNNATRASAAAAGGGAP